MKKTLPYQHWLANSLQNQVNGPQGCQKSDWQNSWGNGLFERVIISETDVVKCNDTTLETRLKHRHIGKMCPKMHWFFFKPSSRTHTTCNKRCFLILRRLKIKERKSILKTSLNTCITSFIHKKLYEVGRINVLIDDRFELVDNRDKDRFEVKSTISRRSTRRNHKEDEERANSHIATVFVIGKTHTPNWLPSRRCLGNCCRQTDLKVLLPPQLPVS